MLANTDYSSRRRFIRSLLPSPLSSLLCPGFGITVIALYVMLQSVNIGTLLPNMLDGELGLAYTNNVVQPLATLFHNSVVSKIIIIFLWGLVGLLTYLLVEYGGYAIRSWRVIRHNVAVTDHSIIRYPGLRSFLIAALWRVTVLIVFSTLFALLVPPLLQSLATVAPIVVLGGIPPAESVRQLVFLALAIGMLAHIFVVFLRWILMRVRLFGNDAY